MCLNSLGGYAITTALESTGKLTAYEFALAAAELAANTRCEDVILLDLRGRSPITEYFLIATGTSARQMRTVADELSDMGKRRGFRPISTGGYDSARWIVIDFVNAVAHVFDADSRDFYDLELLWGDSPRINWRKELGLPEVAMIRNEEEIRRRKEERALAAERAAAEEQRHMEGIDQEEDEEDMEDAGENEPPVVVELPDESTGSNSVEFVEIDSPNKRGDKRSAAFPVTLNEEDAESDMSRLHPVQKKSLDEDVHERFAEENADVDPEARSEEDLPDDRIVTIPMGGVSAGMSSTTIIEDDEDQQRDSIELDEAGANRDDLPQVMTKTRAKPLKAVLKTKSKSKTKAKAKLKTKPKPKARAATKAKPKMKAKTKVKAKAKPKVKAKAKPKAKVKVKAKPKAIKKKSAPAKKKAIQKTKPKKRKR